MSKPEVETIYTMDSEAYDAMRSGIDQLKAENSKLMELVRDMWHYGMCNCADRYDCYSCKYDFPGRIEELGVEV